jgi:aspartate racemase
MRRIGLLGGMSWESSIEYHRFLNEEVRDRVCSLHSADRVLRSVDFAPIEEPQRNWQWHEAGELLATEAAALAEAGAEILILCTNTMHKVANQITQAIDIPFLHIADATAEEVHAAGIGTVGLPATAYTMEQDFYVGRLRDEHGLTVLVPEAEDRRLVHDIIYHELCVGVRRDSSRQQYRRIMRTLADRGAEAILFGCTEIELGASSRRGPQDRAYAESGPRLGAVLLSFVRGSSERRAEAHLWSHK